MEYIILDLEWNQPYSRPSQESGRQMSFEIFQIGAAKLNDRLELIDSFDGMIRLQQFLKLHHTVKKLTGVTAAELERCLTFTEVVTAFRAWCGEEFALITWGYDDIPVLKQNLAFYGLEDDWCDQWYNLQLIFNQQRNEGKNQRSLEYAMEAFEIPADYPRHNAAADAYYTARVAQRLDLKAGLPLYEQMMWQMRPRRMKKVKRLGCFPGRKRLLASDKVNRVCCPICGRVMTEQPKWMSVPDGGYFARVSCTTHGDFTAKLQLKRVPQGLSVIRVVRTARQKAEEAPPVPEKEAELV